MTRSAIVTCVGENLPDAFDQALGGWFSGENVPAEALREAERQGHRVYKFRLTLELLDELKASANPEKVAP